MSQAQTTRCIPYRPGNRAHIAFDSSDYIAPGQHSAYASDSCSRQFSILEVFPAGIAYATNRRAAIEVCAAARRAPSTVIQLNTAPPIPLPGHGDYTFEEVDSNLWRCLNAPAAKRAKRVYIPRPTPATGHALNQTDLELRAFDGFYSGIQFQRIKPINVGIQSVIDLGFLDGVDAWSNIGSGYEVCFPQAGVILFADAANAPRFVEEIDYYTRDHYTCASETRAGTMILVEANPSP